MKAYKTSLLCILAIASQQCNSPADNRSEEVDFYTLDDFGAVKKMDVHFHMLAMDTGFMEQARKDNFQLITVNVDIIDDEYGAGDWDFERQHEVSRALSRQFTPSLAHIEAFTVAGWGNPDWQQQVMAHIKTAVDHNAVGIKVWKNIGMELRGPDGSFVMIDDARFDPVITYIKERGLTLMGHLGEPRNAWLPIEQMTVKGDISYFSQHPNYHMYLHPEYPSYEDQVAARDRMLEKHPDLTFVGAHLGSLEWDVDELAARLDRFPNMAVEMAARISHLQYQSLTDREKVRDFLINYQDRILYGTDIVIGRNADFEQMNKRLHDTWLVDWKYLTSDKMIAVEELEEPVRGLQLPKEVVDKIYYENALTWFPLLRNLPSIGQ